MVHPADLVLEGGGVKGVGLVGALAELEAHGYRFKRVAGSSAGAIVASLVAAGYQPRELEALLLDTDLLKFADMTRLDRVPIAGPALSLLRDRGVLEGTAFRDWLAARLRERGVVTFRDLRERDRHTALAQGRRYRLVVTATDVTRGELVYLPWDYRRVYGLDPDEQLVADAVRASMSFPLAFQPAELRAADGSTAVLVDGGVLSNFPIDVFDRADGTPARWPTIGVKLIHEFAGRQMGLLPPWLPRPRLVRFLEATVVTAVVGHDQRWLSLPSVNARTIRVDTESVGVLDFWASAAKKRELLRHGHDAAAAFLATFDWKPTQYPRAA